MRTAMLGELGANLSRLGNDRPLRWMFFQDEARFWRISDP